MPECLAKLLQWNKMLEQNWGRQPGAGEKDVGRVFLVRPGPGYRRARNQVVPPEGEEGARMSGEPRQPVSAVFLM